MSSKDYAVMPYSDYEGACEAIREKDGSSAPIKSGELRAKILGIETGADVSVVTAARADVREGKIFVKANGLPAEGTMPDVAQATPSISVSSGGLITASATQSEGYVASGTKSATKQLTTQGAKTITPSTSQQTAVASGRYTTGTVTVKAVSTQTKTATPSSSSQTIKPDSGKFLSQVTVSAVSTQTKTVTPTSSAQNVYPDSGKFLSQVTVEAIPSTYKAIHTGSMSSSSGSSSPRYKMTISDSSIGSSSTTIPFLFLYRDGEASYYSRYGFDVTNGTTLVSVEGDNATVTISSGKIVIGSDHPGITSCGNYMFVI